MTVATRLELLELLRDQLVIKADLADSKDLPGVSRELRMVLAEIDVIPSANAKTQTDEIAKRRDERRRKAAGE